MSHQLNECENCGYRFPSKWAKNTHICEMGNADSDRSMLEWLRSQKGANDGLPADASSESRPLQDVLPKKREGL